MLSPPMKFLPCALVALGFAIFAVAWAAEMPASSQPQAAEKNAPDSVKLSLDDAIRIALENNLDVRIAGYTPLISATQINREKSAFDPVMAMGYVYSSQRSPSFSTIIPSTKTQTSLYDASLSVKASTGAILSISSDTGRQTTNNFFLSNVSPFYESNLKFSLTQPLLKGAGIDVNRAGIMVAQNSLKADSSDFEATVMDLVVHAESIYWLLVFRIEDLSAKTKSLQAAEDLLKNNQIKVDAGALAAIEVTRARARVAERTEAVVLARAGIKDAEDELRRILGPDRLPLLSLVEIVPTDVPSVDAAQLELTSSVDYALSMRPEIRGLIADLESSDIHVAVARNRLLPQVDLRASYNLNGLGADLDDDWDMIGDRDQRDISAGIALTVPLGNRLARSDYAGIRLQRLQGLARLAAMHRDITLTVKKSIRDVSTSLQSVDTNLVRRQAAEEQLQAELQKYDVGQSISLDVLDAQEALQQAESAYIASVVSFKLSMAGYYRQVAKTLERRNITIIPNSVIAADGEKIFP